MLQKNRWPQNVKGTLQMELTGPELARFINEAVREQLEISQITWISEEKIRLSIPVPDYFRIKPVLKRTGTKGRILSKKGLPFWLMRLRKRQFFLWGLLLFFVLLYLLTSVLWSVEVEGNETVPTKEIVRLLKKEGVFVGQLKHRIPDNEEIQYRLQAQLPQVSWVGFRVEGTRATVTVVEKKRVDEREQGEKDGPVNLVAKRAAMIYDMNVVRGRPVVEVNDSVKKGQLLVSGRYGNPDDPDSGKLAGAKGKVFGEVWYESKVTVPLQQKRKVYTGRRETARFPFLASRVVRLPFLFPETFSRYETIQQVQTLRFRDWELPFGWVEEERLEMEWVSYKLTAKEAIQLGKERAREDLLLKLGKDGRILGEKVLHPHVERGKVVMKIHFDVVENIAVQQPILQGE